MWKLLLDNAIFAISFIIAFILKFNSFTDRKVIFKEKAIYFAV